MAALGILAGAGVVAGGAGCVSVKRADPPEQKSSYVHRVGPNDLLRVEVVYGEEKLVDTVTVTPDGDITFSLVGSVKVMDRTLTEIEGILREKLTAVLISPGVYVSLAESRSTRVFIFGEVGRQGPIPYHDRLSLAQALAFVGINWTTAKTETVRVVRGSLDDPSLYDIDFDNVLAAGDPDMFLEPGDMVFVPAMYVTRLDRYTNQLLSPIRNLIGAGQQAAGAATTGLTGVPVP